MPRTTLITLILFFFFTACAEKQMIIWRGNKVTVDIASRQSLGEIEGLYKKGEKERAKIECEKFLRTFPENPYIDDVYYYLGIVAYDNGDFEEAIRNLSRFQNVYQKSNKRVPALFYLGLTHKNLGNHEISNSILLPIASSKMNREETLLLYQALANNFEILGNYRSTLTWRLKEYALFPDGTLKEKQKQKIIEIIDERLTLQDLRELIEFVDTKFPSDYYYVKLIKYLYHIQEYDEALALSEKFLTQFSPHQYTDEVQRINEKLTKTTAVKPKKIGCLLPLTGKFASYGNDVLQGILLGSGIFSDDDEGTIEIEIRDTEADATKADNLLSDLYENENVIAIIGPLTQEEAPSAAIEGENLKLPIITLSQKEHLTNIGDFVFRNFITKSNQVDRLVRFARIHIGIKNFAILYPDHSHGQEFAHLFWDSVLKYGGAITNIESYGKDQKDFGNELKKLAETYYPDARSDEICTETDRFKNKIKGLNCFPPYALPPKIEFEALFIPDTYHTVSLIAPALTFYDITGVQLLGINSLNHPDFISRSGEENIQGMLFTDIFFSESSNKSLQDFTAVYKKTYARDPNLFSALGYDTINIVKLVLNHYKPTTRQTFKDALHSIKSYNGVTGTTSFAKNNDADKDLYLLSVDNGKIVEVK